MSGAPAGALPARVRIGYGLGSLCTGTFGTVPGLILLYYLTDVLAVPAALAGAAVFLPKAWDVLVNPLVGAVSDRSTWRAGPRRPFMLIGACTLPPLFALLFAAPPLRGAAAAGYVAVVFLLAATAYAVFQVPYVTMPAEMTEDEAERGRMLGWRVGFLGAAILLSGAVAPALAHAGGDTAAGYRLMGAAVAGLLAVGMFGAWHATRRAPSVARSRSEPSLRATATVDCPSVTCVNAILVPSDDQEGPYPVARSRGSEPARSAITTVWPSSVSSRKAIRAPSGDQTGPSARLRPPISVVRPESLRT